MVPERRICCSWKRLKRYQMNIVIHHAKTEIEKLKELHKLYPNHRPSIEEQILQWEALIIRQEQKQC